jgi:putative nucleotidyltransferase with HDIG domain
MVDRADEALRKWSHALAVRTFYPGTHPTVRLAETELLDELRGMHEQSGPVAIAVLGDRLLYGNEPLPSAASAGRPIQKVLSKAYVDRVTFERGLTTDELGSFLDSMIAASRGQGLLRDTTRIRLEYVVREEEREELLDRSSSLVKDIHAKLGEVQGIASTELSEVANGLMALAASPHSAILPLAKIKAHDEYTFVHTVNVAILSAATAHMLGCDRTVVRDILLAGILHDVGKQRVPLEILNKPGRLTEEEAVIVRKHPEDGARMLLRCAGIPDLAVIVAYEHHQRCDTSGYPQTPISWQPHIASRIVQVADVFDALRTNRPYRAALPVRRILEIFEQDRASFSDPDLVRLFLSEVALRGKDVETIAASEAETGEQVLAVQRL